MYQTMQEIEKQYDGHWVFMTDCKTGEFDEIIGGVVIAHNKNKKPVAELWSEKYDTEVYFRYIGSIPDECFSDGVLGMNILDKFNFKVDLDQNFLELEKRK